VSSSLKIWKRSQWSEAVILLERADNKQFNCAAHLKEGWLQPCCLCVKTRFLCTVVPFSVDFKQCCDKKLADQIKVMVTVVMMDGLS